MDVKEAVKMLTALGEETASCRVVASNPVSVAGNLLGVRISKVVEGDRIIYSHEADFLTTEGETVVELALDI